MAGLINYRRALINTRYWRIQWPMDGGMGPTDMFTAVCEPQVELEVDDYDSESGELHCRVDFLLYATRWGYADEKHGMPVFCPIVIEVDGHEFHERTKEQAQRDKSRDRALTGAGYRVLRFTGSEVFRDPIARAESIMFQLEEMASDLLARLRDANELQAFALGDYGAIRSIAVKWRPKPA